MLLHFTICDDDADMREFLRAEVSAWAKACGHTVTVDSFPSAEAFLFEYSENKSCEVLLLDIEMPGMNGMELAHKLRSDNAMLQIIFVTGYSDYISEGYDVSALHYLMKPVSQEKLFGVLSKAAKLYEKNSKNILLECTDGVFLLPISEIRFIEVAGNYVTVHGGRDYTVKSTLASIEKQLDESFYKTGRSFLVSLDKIRQVTKKEVFLTTGEAVPLSRGVYEKLIGEIISRK